MFLCAQCPKTFIDKKKLRDHQRNHVSTVDKEVMIKQEVPELVEDEYIESNNVEFVEKELNMEQEEPEVLVKIKQEESKLPLLDEIKIFCKVCQKEVKI